MDCVALGSHYASRTGSSATPLRVCCAPSPFTVREKGAQWRVKGRSRGKRAQQTRVNRWASGLADAGGAPGTVRGGGVSESVAKAPRAGIGGEKKRGISTILLRHPGSIRAFATDSDERRRRGPLRGRRPRRSPRPPGQPAPPLGRRDVHFALERALLTAHLEGEMHLSRAKCTSRRAQDRPAHPHPPPRAPPPPPAPPAPPRPGPPPPARRADGEAGRRCHAAGRLRGRISAWSTAERGGPCADRPSCARRRGRRGSGSPPSSGRRGWRRGRSR